MMENFPERKPWQLKVVSCLALRIHVHMYACMKTLYKSTFMIYTCMYISRLLFLHSCRFGQKYYN
jgi:hypothetical protein